MKNITKISRAKFKISTPDVPGSELELDFNPIIDEFNLTGNFILIHWQAKPKGFRQWGLYSSKEDNYQSVGRFTQNIGRLKSLQLNDQSVRTIPSAVLYSDQSQYTCIDDRLILGEVLLSDLS